MFFTDYGASNVRYQFNKCVARYRGEYWSKIFPAGNNSWPWLLVSYHFGRACGILQFA